jgi:hypothetical protein
MMEAETVSEMLDHNSILTLLFTQEDFIAFSRHESFKSYRGKTSFLEGPVIIDVSAVERVVVLELELVQG